MSKHYQIGDHVGYPLGYGKVVAIYGVGNEIDYEIRGDNPNLPFTTRHSAKGVQRLEPSGIVDSVNGNPAVFKDMPTPANILSRLAHAENRISWAFDHKAQHDDLRKTFKVGKKKYDHAEAIKILKEAARLHEQIKPTLDRITYGIKSD